MRAILKCDTIKDIVFDEAGKVITSELVDLCKLDNPSLLRSKEKENLQSLTWDSINEEFKVRCPKFHQFLLSSVSNPSHSRNVYKKDSALLPPMVDAGCQLISVFNENLDAVRKIKSVVLKKGGLKKIAFKRLASLNNCMGYNATSNMFESFGKKFDQTLKEWKTQVEEDVKQEKLLIAEKEQTLSANEPALVDELEAKIQDHRDKMHPGYSFTSDNVDIRCNARQMTVKNRDKDNHLYHLLAFKNRVSSNHLSSDSQSKDINKEPFTTFLPNAQEQEILIDEFLILVGHKWCTYIPALGWFKE